MVDIHPSYSLLLPQIILAATGLIVLVADLYTRNKRSLAYWSLLGILIALASVAVSAQTATGEYWGRMLYADPFTFFTVAVFLLVAVLVILVSMDYVEKRIGWAPVEFYELVIFATLGMTFMGASRDLIMIYIGLELASQTSYVMAALLRKDPRSNEAGIKYFLNGAMASAVLLYGLSLLYGLTGTTYLPEMAVKLARVGGTDQAPVLYAAVVFLIGGFGFKVAAAPFHLWAPDVYEGAPTPVTGFFSVGPKAAAFAAILRTFVVGLTSVPGAVDRWVFIFAVLAVVSMFIGNLTALWQSNIKRMMAYSSIAQAGYILVGVATSAFADPAGRLGVEAVLYYVLGYAVSNIGIFAIITALENSGSGVEVSDFRGLAQRNPALAWSMTLLFLSLIGIPPTVGFFGKFLLFQVSWQTGYWWLATSIALNSVISVGYYYGIVRTMFFEQAPAGSAETALGTGRPLGAAVAISVLATLAIGIYAAPAFDYAKLASGLMK